MDEARKRAKKKYQSKVKRFTVDFYPTEAEIWEHLQAQEKKQTYIKDLIRADIEKTEEGEWIPAGDGFLKCSMCGGSITHDGFLIYPSYCLHCKRPMKPSEYEA